MIKINNFMVLIISFNLQLLLTTEKGVCKCFKFTLYDFRKNGKFHIEISRFCCPNEL